MAKAITAKSAILAQLKRVQDAIGSAISLSRGPRSEPRKLRFSERFELRQRERRLQAMAKAARA